ncbi:MAG: hypothetical protein IPM42_14680 [Saprospiraceae bacterium]|nr:hypothetical protein [Saprospiraceae bacterium]
MNLTLHLIKAAYAKKGYSYFTGSKPYNLNLWGVRKQYGDIDKFDDLIGLSYFDEGGNEQFFTHKATVDPGKYNLLEKTMHPLGTFILAPGQYRGCWRTGFHNASKPTKYPALVQKAGYTGFKGWRDNLLNGKIDRILDSNGQFFNNVTGLNMHRSSSSYATIVGKYSAACQVRQHNSSHLRVMEIIQKALQYYPDSFSYTLFDEEEVFPSTPVTRSTRDGSSSGVIKKWPEDFISVES